MKTPLRILYLLFACSATRLLAQVVPEYINYQGLLRDAAGQPLTNGNYVMEFNIYDQANAGTRVWGPFLFDDNTGADGHGLKVPVIDGNFNVILGPRDTNHISITNAFAAASRFIEIRVGGGSPILPRQQFLSTAYAVQSQKADYATLASNLVQQVADTLCPPGTIVAFGGTNIPAGWLLCNGTSLATNGYYRLWQAIRYGWGGSGTTFRLPELRGRFLRGQSAGSGTDPDAAGRSALYTGGATGDAVGSFQLDADQRITGYIGAFNTFAAMKGSSDGPFYREYAFGSSGIGAGSGDPYDYVRMDTARVLRTSSESRPKNAAVNFIIKY